MIFIGSQPLFCYLLLVTELS